VNRLGVAGGGELEGGGRAGGGETRILAQTTKSKEERIVENTLKNKTRRQKKREKSQQWARGYESNYGQLEWQKTIKHNPGPLKKLTRESWWGDEKKRTQPLQPLPKQRKGGGSGKR